MRYEKPKAEVILFLQPGFLVNSWSFFAMGKGLGLIKCEDVTSSGGYYFDSYECNLVLAVDPNIPGDQPRVYPNIPFQCSSYYDESIWN